MEDSCCSRIDEIQLAQLTETVGNCGPLHCEEERFAIVELCVSCAIHGLESGKNPSLVAMKLCEQLLRDLWLDLGRDRIKTLSCYTARLTAQLALDPAKLSGLEPA